MAAQPTTLRLTCPRCRCLRMFVAIDGVVTYRCSACEWYYRLSPVAPTGTASAGLAAGGTAITVVSGGASFTSGMLLLIDTATATGSATSIPVTAAVRAHLSGFTFGQLSIAPRDSGFGVGGAVIPAPSWGY